MIKKVFGKLHLWLSIPFGLIITIICFTGAVLVFETEIMQKLRPELYYVTPSHTRALPIDQLAKRIHSTLPDSILITSVTIQGDPSRTYLFNLSQPRRSSISIDPYTGIIKGRVKRTSFFSFIFRSHRWLLDTMRPNSSIYWGKMIVGISTLMFVFVLISGLVIWIPKNFRSLLKRLRIRTQKGWRLFWFDLHVSAGFYTAGLLLIMALTGPTWSFAWYRTGLISLLGADSKRPSSTVQKDNNNGNGNRKEAIVEHQGKKRSPFTHWGNVYKELSEQNPNFDKITLAKSSASVSYAQWGNQRASDTYRFDPHNGEITNHTPYQQIEQSIQIRGWFYSLHVGNWGGLFSKILYFLAALIGASLPLTGYYFWLPRLGRKRKTA